MKRICDLQLGDRFKRGGVEYRVTSISDCLRYCNDRGKVQRIGKKSMELVEYLGRDVKTSIAQVKNGIILSEFDSITEASTVTGLRFSGIGNCLHGRQRTCGGYVWKRAS